MPGSLKIISCANHYQHAFGCSDSRTDGYPRGLSVKIFVTVVGIGVVEGSVAQRCGHHIGSQTVGHFGACNPVIFFYKVFRRNIFGKCQKIRGLGSCPDKMPGNYSGQGSQHIKPMGAFFIYICIAIGKIMGSDNSSRIEQVGECRTLIGKFEPRITNINQHSISQIIHIMEKITVNHIQLMKRFSIILRAINFGARNHGFCLFIFSFFVFADRFNHAHEIKRQNIIKQRFVG